jgi:hypothetical protein
MRAARYQPYDSPAGHPERWRDPQGTAAPPGAAPAMPTDPASPAVPTGGPGRALPVPAWLARAAVAAKDFFVRGVDYAISRVECTQHARYEAARRLAPQASGPDGEAVACIWPRRRPGLYFTLVPLGWFAAVAGGALLAQRYFGDFAYLRGIRVPGVVLDGVRLTAHDLIAWWLPVALSAVFAHRAWRLQVPLRWPIVTTALICSLAAWTGLGLAPATGSRGALAAAGPEPFSPEGLLARAALALTCALTVVVPLVVAARSSARGVEDRGTTERQAGPAVPPGADDVHGCAMSATPQRAAYPPQVPIPGREPERS